MTLKMVTLAAALAVLPNVGTDASVVRTPTDPVVINNEMQSEIRGVMGFEIECWTCRIDRQCGQAWQLWHRIPEAAEIEPPGGGEEEGPEEVVDGPEGCHYGGCVPLHDSCSGFSPAIQAAMNNAIRENDVARIRRLLDGRAIVVDFERGTLAVLRCKGLGPTTFALPRATLLELTAVGAVRVS
jgi:hypothetical protein